MIFYHHFWMVEVINFFPHTARLLNYLCAECFPLTFNLNGFNPNLGGVTHPVGFPLITQKR